MAEKSWLKKIAALKRMLNEIGPLWPSPSTRLAGYAEDGPYHCEDCVYLKKDFNEDGQGRCSQPVMIADSQVKHDNKGLAIVNIQRGCCEFVEPPKAAEPKKES